MTSAADALVEGPVAGASTPEELLLTPAAEARLLWGLRRTMIRAMIRQALTTARLRVTLVVLLSIFFWYGLFFLFGEGFHFLSKTISHSVTQAQTVQAIYNVFFASLL